METIDSPSLHNEAVAPARSRKIFSAIQASTGNFFEAFDLIVFGTFATIISSNFFPHESEYMSVMLTFMTFAAAYVMRVVGALVLGPYFDRMGRRNGLLVSLTLMAFGTGLIAFAPTYATVGILAPTIIVIARLIQGFSIGAETGGVTAYLVEIAPKNRNAFYVSWNSVCFHLAGLVAIGLGYFLNKYLSAQELKDWGWRVPFIIGCGVVPIIFLMRRNLEESEAFTQQHNVLSVREIFSALAANWAVAVTGMFMVVLSSCVFYFMLTYMPLFAKNSLGISTEQSLLSTIYVSIYCVVLVPIFAIISDKIGRFPIMATAATLLILTAYPFLRYLTDNPSYYRLIVVQFWYATLYAGYASSAFVAMSEMVPTKLRATGYGVATTLGLALFGGFTPLVAEWISHNIQDKAAPSGWLMLLATCSLVSIYLLAKRKIAMKT